MSNFFRVWGTSSESLNGIWPVKDHILTSGRVGRCLKEMISVAISSLRSCHYNEAAHHFFAYISAWPQHKYKYKN